MEALLPTIVAGGDMGMGYIFLSLSAEEAIRISFRLAHIYFRSPRWSRFASSRWMLFTTAVPARRLRIISTRSVFNNYSHR
jgi:hypothetical protein